MAGERTLLPIFPLGAVLYPGMVLPLNIFEERYRRLIHDLLLLPDPEMRRFGVIAIRQGREVGADAVESLYDVGTLAVLTRVGELPDGRLEVVAVGTERFRLHTVDRTRAYLQARVDIFDETAIAAKASQHDSHIPGVVGAFRSYVTALGTVRGDDIPVPDLPSGPTLLSWLVAASAIVDLPVRQRLLEIEGTDERLAAEIDLLRSETNMLKKMRSAPAPYLVRQPQHPN